MGWALVCMITLPFLYMAMCLLSTLDIFYEARRVESTASKVALFVVLTLLLPTVFLVSPFLGS